MGYGQKVGKAYGRGALQSCIVSIVGLVLGVSLVSTVLWVAGGNRASSDSYRPLLALTIPSVFMVALGLVAVIFVALRSRRLDQAFAGLEVEGHQVGGVLRGWHGEVGGRTFDAWFRKGPTVELYLGCEPGTRGGIARTSELALFIARSLTTREALEPTPSQVAGCTVYADDPAWMRRFLASPGVDEVLARLLAETRRVSPMLSVTPSALHYMRRFGPVAEFNRDNVHSWLADLERLATAVDSIGPSASAEQPSKLEAWSRTRRGRRYLPVFLGCLVLLMLATSVMMIALFYSAHY